MSLCAVLAGPCIGLPSGWQMKSFFPLLLGEGSVWYKTHTQTHALKGFCSSLIYYLQATHNSLWPCMVRKFPHTHTKKALHHWIVLQISHLVAIPFGATLLGEMLAEVRDVLHDIGVKAAWRSAMYNFAQKTVSLLLFISISCLSFSSSSFVFSFFHISIFFYIHLSHTSTKEWGSVLCPEGNFVVLSHLPTSNSQPPRATSEKMETVFCLGEDIWFM